ncbi:DUF1102 domain-containing protein [Natrialbaceae archaeon A-chndr2]
MGVGSASIGGSALLGTGAFSRVESQRSVTIEVAEDPDAYLGLDKCGGHDNPTPNGSYAHLDDDGHLEILMNDENPTIGGTHLGEGINSNSTTWFDNVFQICNQGKEDACVWISDSDAWPRVDGGESNRGERRVEFYLGSDDDRSLIGEENAIGLALGECVCVGIKTRSYGLSEGEELLGELDNAIQINADVGAECVTTPPEDITESGRLSLAYEDLPKEESDWDYNDWVVDIFGTFVKGGRGGSGGIKEFRWDIVPQARLAGDSHMFEFEFDCPGEYTVAYYEADGTPAGSDTESFDAGDVAITVWDDTDEVIDSLSDGCVVPDEWAHLIITFDDYCEFDTAAFDGGFSCHGSDLPFNPVLENNDTAGVRVERGDMRLLAVNEAWNYPKEGTPIWDAYDGVVEDDGMPDFGPDCDLGDENEDNTVDCNVVVNPDKSLSAE